MRQRGGRYLYLFCLLALGIPSQVPASIGAYPGALAWGEKWVDEYGYVVVDQDVRSVLMEVGRNLAYPVEISRNVRGRVRNGFSAESAREFLDKLSMESGIAWFFDGAMIHVNTQQELDHRSFELRDGDAERVLSDIANLGMGYPLVTRIRDGRNGAPVLQAWGPLAWVEGVERLLESPAAPQVRTAAGGSNSVRVFRGGSSQVEYAN